MILRTDLGRNGQAHAPTYLDEDHEVVLAALEHATDLIARESWETTFWTRCHADAQILLRMVRRSVFEVTGRMEQPVFACVGLVRARRPKRSDPDAIEDTWGVFVAVRPG